MMSILVECRQSFQRLDKLLRILGAEHNPRAIETSNLDSVLHFVTVQVRQALRLHNFHAGDVTEGIATIQLVAGDAGYAAVRDVQTKHVSAYIDGLGNCRRMKG